MPRAGRQGLLDDDETNSEWLWRHRFHFGLIACILTASWCWLKTESPEVFKVDVKNFVWDSATCKVVAAGLEYQGTCPVTQGDFDVNDGNYSSCSPFLWCANEGGTCDCVGTVRFGSKQLAFLTDTTVDLEVNESTGSIPCTVEAFGEDPAMFRRKQCLCRPAALASITDEVLSPPTCKSAVSLEAADPAWLRALRKAQTQGDNCTHFYLPWAMVEVRKADSDEAPIIRCAYEYGLAKASLMAQGNKAIGVLGHLEPGREIPCNVLAAAGEVEAVHPAVEKETEASEDHKEGSGAEEPGESKGDSPPERRLQEPDKGDKAEGGEEGSSTGPEGSDAPPEETSTSAPSVDLGPLEGCVVALKQPDSSRLTRRWAAAWMRQAEIRYDGVWALTGLGFAIVACGVMSTIKERREAAAREGPDREYCLLVT